MLLLLLACTTQTIYVAPTCTLDAPAAEPAAAPVGATVTLTSRALTEAWDTVVTIGSARAEVVAVDRDGCSDCDSCLNDTGVEDCLPCTPQCDSCAEACATCVETARIRVPDLPPGDYEVFLTNVHGSSTAGAFTVTAK